MVRNQFGSVKCSRSILKQNRLELALNLINRHKLLTIKMHIYFRKVLFIEIKIYSFDSVKVFIDDMDGKLRVDQIHFSSFFNSLAII